VKLAAMINVSTTITATADTIQVVPNSKRQR
jgi:hypothetical protein